MAKGMRSAVNQHCKDCIYDDMSGLGTWRQQVEGCTVVKCALYEFRPRAYVSKIESNASDCTENANLPD